MNSVKGKTIGERRDRREGESESERVREERGCVDAASLTVKVNSARSIGVDFSDHLIQLIFSEFVI